MLSSVDLQIVKGGLVFLAMHLGIVHVNTNHFVSVIYFNTQVEIKPGNSFRDYRKKWISGKNEPGEFSLPVEYMDTTVEQVEALTKVSDFCWQVSMLV